MPNDDTRLVDLTLKDIRESVRAIVKEEMETINTEPQEEFLTRKEAAAMLKVSIETLRNWTEKGILPGYYQSKVIRYKRSDVLNCLKRFRNPHKQTNADMWGKSGEKRYG